MFSFIIKYIGVLISIIDLHSIHSSELSWIYVLSFDLLMIR